VVKIIFEDFVVQGKGRLSYGERKTVVEPNVLRVKTYHI